MTQRVLLTDEFVEAARSSAVGEDRIWDVRLKGFCLRIHPSGRKVYCLKHMADGRAVWRTIGQHASPWTAGQARAAAEEILRAEIDLRAKTEAQKLFRTLASMESSGQLNPVHGAAIRLLLLTGARKSEIVGLSWSELDLDRRRIVLPPSRSKSGGSNGERRIPLSQAAIDLLNAQPRLGDHVFPAAKGGGGHFTGLHKSWTNVREAAGLGGMRIHDLRHSFASFAMDNGENIVAIGRALGHADMRTTQRYLHLRDQEITDLAERMGQLLAS